MHWLAFVFIGLASIATWASASASASASTSLEPLEDPCEGWPCSPAQSRIANAFDTAGRPEILEASLWSGDCYHLPSGYDGARAHHAVVLLEPDEQASVFFRGIFSFFAPTNPYGDWTIERARRELAPIRDPEKHRVRFGAEDAFVDMNPGQAPIWVYRMRADAQDRLLVAGQWGIGHLLLCELNPHRP